MSSGTPAHRALPPDAAPRAARWSVPASAVVALLVLASVVGVAAAVRTAEATPGVAVPERADASAAATTPSSPEPSASPPEAPAGAGTPGGDVVVHVVGAVGAPGLVTLANGSRVADALDAVGGAAEDADLTRVNLARLLVDGEQVVVPRPGEPLPAAPPAAGQGGGDTAAPAGPLDLNAATLDQLDDLPGIGPVLGQRILDWRSEHGAFTSVGELAEVSGIGDAVLADLEQLVTV